MIVECKKMDVESIDSSRREAQQNDKVAENENFDGRMLKRSFLSGRRILKYLFTSA